MDTGQCGTMKTGVPYIKWSLLLLFRKLDNEKWFYRMHFQSLYVDNLMFMLSYFSGDEK